jgi:hypothetical protein
VRRRRAYRVALWCAGLAMLCAGCRKTAPPAPRPGPATRAATKPSPANQPDPGRRRDYRAVHVFVVLCDNQHQGIAPVPQALGNGQDPAGNLYWGAMYGVKTFFATGPHWRRVPPGDLAVARDDCGAVLDTVVFESTAPGARTYVLAEAFDGARMDVALREFFEAAAGRLSRVAVWGGGPRRVVVLAGGAADMVCFVGHNGLMDGRPEHLPSKAPGASPSCAVVLACRSREYFIEPLRRAGCPPLITTTALMAPEAYTLEAIVRSWAAGEAPASTHLRAAEAYAKYQKCSLPAAKRLFAIGAEPVE